MQVLVIGANGATGRQLTEHLARKTSHDPVAMIRDGRQAGHFDAIGVPHVLGDLTHPIDHAVQGCEAVIFAAGSGGATGKDLTVLVDHLGAIKAAVTAQRHGVRRFILLSSINARPDSDSKIAHYHRAKGLADQWLMQADQVLDGDPLLWTTIHPGKLTDEEATGRVAVSEGVLGSGSTSRANTALALAACLDRPGTIGRQWSVLDGETPVAEAFPD